MEGCGVTRDASKRAACHTELDCISFSNVGLQQSAIDGKNGAIHLQRVVEHCVALLTRGMLVIFVCEMGDNQKGAGHDFQRKFETALRNKFQHAELQFHWNGELLCLAKSCVDLTVECLSAGCKASTQQWRYVQVVDINYKTKPVKIYHCHLTSSLSRKLTDATRTDVFLTIAHHAQRCPMKHGWIIGGDMNSSIYFLTPLFSCHRALFASHTLVFPDAEQTQRHHGDLAISWGLDIVHQKSNLRADSAHHTVIAAWPRMEQWEPAPEGQLEPLPARAREAQPRSNFQRIREMFEVHQRGEQGDATRREDHKTAAPAAASPAILPTSTAQTPALPQAVVDARSYYDVERGAASIDVHCFEARAEATQRGEFWLHHDAEDDVVDHAMSDGFMNHVGGLTEEVLAPTTTLSCNTEPSGLRVCAEAFYEQEDTSLGSLEARGLLLDTTFASQGRDVAMDELSNECFACLRTDAVDSGVPTTAELADASQRGDPGTDDTVRQCLTPRTTNDGSCSWCDGTLQPAELHISNDGAPGLNHCADDDQTCFEGRSNASQGAHANAAIGEMRAANADVLSAPMCVSALLRCMLPEERDRSDQVQRFIKFAEEPSTAMSETLTPETNELIQGICIDLFWRRTSPDGALLQLADVNVFSELYRVRREVHWNDRAELTETDIKRCWKILYDEFMTTLSPQKSRYTTRKKHSLFHSSLKRRFGNKRFIFAVWQTGMTWLPEPWDMRPHAMVNALFAWCRRFRTAEREYLQRVNEADGTQPFRM